MYTNCMKKQRFGGRWTETKLEIVTKYVNAYITLMCNNERAKFLRKIYLDGFAGSGRRYLEDGGLLAELGEDEVQSFFTGSAHRALESAYPFNEYIFVEPNSKYALALEQMVCEFPQLENRVRIENCNANDFIPKWADQLGDLDRGLVFLDPYGMQLSWTTIEALAKTGKIDCWVLVPVGPAFRLVSRDKPPEKWCDALTRFFGTEEWFERFFSNEMQDTLFGPEEKIVRTATLESFQEYVLTRLREEFLMVLEDPILLSNSRGMPLYLLCFGSSNEKGAPTAIKIAKDITRKIRNGN
jgi:three-Cys-motif partner protein